MIDYNENLLRIAWNEQTNSQKLNSILDFINLLDPKIKPSFLKGVVKNPNADKGILNRILDLHNKGYKIKPRLLENIAKGSNADKGILNRILDLHKKGYKIKPRLLKEIVWNKHANKNILNRVLRRIDSLNANGKAGVLISVADNKHADKNMLCDILEKTNSLHNIDKLAVLMAVKKAAKSLPESEKKTILKLVAEMRSGKEAGSSVVRSASSWVSRVSSASDRAGPSLGE